MVCRLRAESEGYQDFLMPVRLAKAGTIAFNDFAVPFGRFLWCALLRLVIHVDQSKALAVALAPLKVVEQ